MSPRLREACSAQDLQCDLADDRGIEPWIGVAEQPCQCPRMLIEQLAVCASEVAQIVHPVVRWRLGDEAPEDPVEQSVDELLLRGEVAVQCHRSGLEACGNGAQGEGFEAWLRYLLRRIKDQLAGERTARST